MKALITKVSLLLFLTAGVAYGQVDYAFKVLANKGVNEVYPKSAETIWEPLKTGAVLKEGDKIKVGENAYVGLMHESGRTVELVTAGEYQVADLASMSGNGSVAGKYADFVMSRMTDDEEDINENHRKHLKVTGAVERSLVSAIPVMMPSSAEVLNDEALIKWQDVAPENGYVLTFTNMFDQVISTSESKQASFNINLDDPKFSGEKIVIFRVSVKGDEGKVSDKYGIKRVSDKEAANINKDLEALKAQLHEGTALDKLILASFYEQHNLLVDALANYEAAINLHPEVKEFEVAYEQFKHRNGLIN